MSQLTKAYETNHTVLELPAEIIENHSLIEPSYTLGFRTINGDGIEIKQLLVQWKGLPKEDTTWEDYGSFTRTYPNFNLRDKVVFLDRETTVTRHRTKLR